MLGILIAEASLHIPTVRAESKVSIERDGIRLAIPADYVRNLKDISRADVSVLLAFVYPDFRAASRSERASGHTIDSRYIMADLTRSRRTDYAEYMATELERLKDPKSNRQQVTRVPDRDELPQFEIYAPVHGDRGSLLYAMHINGRKILARCVEAVPNPGCVVAFRWQKNLHVRYFFRRHWLGDLHRLHEGLEAKLLGFVVEGDVVGRQ